MSQGLCPNCKNDEKTRWFFSTYGELPFVHCPHNETRKEEKEKEECSICEDWGPSEKEIKYRVYKGTKSEGDFFADFCPSCGRKLK